MKYQDIDTIIWNETYCEDEKEHRANCTNAAKKIMQYLENKGIKEISKYKTEGASVIAGRCEYQEDNKNCTAKSCPHHAIRGTTSDGTCILYPKPLIADGKELPKGRTCRSCLHTFKCKQLGIYNPDSIICDWDPCRYAEYHGDMVTYPKILENKKRAPMRTINWPWLIVWTLFGVMIGVLVYLVGR